MDLRDMIMRLSEARGPSGFEQGARETAAALLRGLTDEMKTDRMGNLLAVRHTAKPQAPTVMLEAHIDEIGLIVTGFAGGFLRFDTLGHVDARILPAMEVMVLSDPPLFGVIDVLPPHLTTAEEREKPMDSQRLCIDLGLSETQARRRVTLGTPAVFTSVCTPLGERRLSGKSLDNRSCVAAVIHALELVREKELGCHVAVALCVQEEVGCRGAVTAAYAVDPEAALVVDVTYGGGAGSPEEKTFPLGGGPTIGVGPNMTRAVSEKLLALARRRGIPYNIEVMSGHSGTDAWPVQVSRGGVATGVVSLPLRYMHTPVELLDLRDAQATAELLAAWLESYGTEADDRD